MLKPIHFLIALVFLAPIAAVLVMHRDTMVEDMTPRPENGYLVYYTMDR